MIFFGGGVNYPLNAAYHTEAQTVFLKLFLSFFTVPHMTLHLYFRNVFFPLLCLSGVLYIYIFSYCSWILGYKQESYVIVSG